MYLPVLRKLGDQLDGRAAYADWANEVKKLMQEIKNAKTVLLDLAKKYWKKIPADPQCGMSF